MSKVPFVIYYWDSLVYIFVKPHNVLIYYIAKFFFIKSNYVARNGEVASPDGCIEVTAILLIIFRFSLRPEGIYHGNLSELFLDERKIIQQENERKLYFWGGVGCAGGHVNGWARKGFTIKFIVMSKFNRMTTKGPVGSSPQFICLLLR